MKKIKIVVKTMRPESDFTFQIPEQIRTFVTVAMGAMKLPTSSFIKDLRCI